MDEGFQHDLIEIVKKALSKGHLSFCSLLRKCRGAYPTDVLLVLSSIPDWQWMLRNEGHGKNATVERVPRESLVEQEINEKLNELAISHPAEFDWRFTSSTVNMLAKRVEHMPDAATVGLLGVPTLYVGLRVSGLKDVRLYNKSEAVMDSLRESGFSSGLVVKDLFKPLSSDRLFDLVVADPPWYLDYYEAFIARAAQILKIGGHFWLSVLPPLTRPNAKRDREQIFEYCETYGFELLSLSEDELVYQSPQFELVSLKEQEIYCSDWRTGDLALFRKRNHNPNASTEFRSNEPDWKEYCINGVRLKLKIETNDETAFRFVTIGDSPALTSVSRRLPGRERINFWTSNNYAFEVKKIQILEKVLMMLEKGYKKDDAIAEVETEYFMDGSEIQNLTSVLELSGVL